MFERFERFTVLITKINRAVRRIKTQEMQGLDLKSPHVSCLYYLHKTPMMTATQLCQKTSQDRAAMSRALDFLEKNDYLVCLSDAKKRYNSPLKLTEKGEGVAKVVVEKIDSVLAQTAETMSEDDRMKMYQMLTIVERSLSEYCRRYEQ